MGIFNRTRGFIKAAVFLLVAAAVTPVMASFPGGPGTTFGTTSIHIEVRDPVDYPSQDFVNDYTFTAEPPANNSYSEEHTLYLFGANPINGDSATLHFKLIYGPSNKIIINFDGEAPAGNASTEYKLTATTLLLNPPSPAIVSATAGITVTDGDTDGVTATGEFTSTPGSTAAPLSFGTNRLYRALYGPASNATSIFADLVVPVSGPPANTDHSNDPTGSTPPIPIGTLGSIRSEWAFTLSPLDSISGTSRLTALVPEPSSLVLLATGALLLLARSVRSRKRA